MFKLNKKIKISDKLKFIFKFFNLVNDKDNKPKIISNSLLKNNKNKINVRIFILNEVL
tara:strand:+ start:163 stop:336 length:174 start_codon:yes stop_codon:yes gene_type:complete